MKRGIKIIHNKKIFAVIILMLAVMILLAFLIPKQENQLEEGKCKVDSDCVKQQISCCSCNMGGKEECMTRQNASFWQEKLADCEEGLLCIAMYNCKDISCKCIEGVCVEE